MDCFGILIEHAASLSSSPRSYRRQFIVLLVLPGIARRRTDLWVR